MLDQLESFAYYEIGRRTLSAVGSFRIFNRDAYVDVAFANQEVIFFESLEGLEARIDGRRHPSSLSHIQANGCLSPEGDFGSLAF